MGNKVKAQIKLHINKVHLIGHQIVLPQHESEMLAAIMGKTPASFTQDAMVTLCALREDVAISTPPTDTTTTSTSQQLVTQSSDPFLGLLGNEDGGQQQTSPEQTEDDEAPGEQVVMQFSMPC
jgi:hypothetical protein